MVMVMPNIHSSISFALVNIPVLLSPIIKNNDTSFNQLHKKCLQRIKYIKYCPRCKKDVKESDIVKGYQFEKDNYLVFSKTELDNLKPDGDKEIEVISFVKEGSVPPWYFEKSYFLNTEKKSKAYNLFYEALKKTKRVALVKTVIGPKFYYGILKLVPNGIILTTLYFEEEVRIPDKNMEIKVTNKELDLAVKLIESMDGEFKPHEYKDEYQETLKKAIDAKLDGKKITKTKSTNKKQINDLMKALEKSLKEKK